MQLEVVVNRGAGSVEDGGDERSQILEAFAPLGHEPRVELVAGADLADAVAAAIERGADVVAVAGGDGTLGTVAAALLESDDGTILGVLPQGTFNHFAKDLSIPVDLAEAARTIIEGETVAVDLAEVNGRVFVNNSTLGVYPVMVDLRDEIRSSRGWGKVRAVPVASWRVLRRYPTRRLHIEAGGEAWDLRTPFVFIGNNTYEVGPRGVGARTEMAAGTLCCFVARVESRLGFLRMAFQALTRGASAAPTLESVCTGDVVVRAHGHRVLVALDGEIATLRAPLRYRSRPGALRVRVPVGAQPLGDPPPGPDAGSGVEQSGDR